MNADVDVKLQDAHMYNLLDIKLPQNAPNQASALESLCASSKSTNMGASYSYWGSRSAMVLSLSK